MTITLTERDAALRDQRRISTPGYGWWGRPPARSRRRAAIGTWALPTTSSVSSSGCCCGWPEDDRRRRNPVRGRPARRRPCQRLAAGRRAGRLAWSAPAPGPDSGPSTGPAPAAEYAAQLTFDLLVHGWDLAKAVRAPELDDAGLVRLGLSDLEPRGRTGGRPACSTWP